MMVKYLAIFLVLGLAACGPNQAAQRGQVTLGACDTYGATLHTLAAWMDAGELSDRDVARVDFLRPRMNSICAGEVVPTDAVLLEFNAALADLLIMERASQ